MFTRTSAGIGNRALFTKAHFTVYVETDPNCDPTRAIDVAFWREFFRHFFPGFRVSFSPLGGKDQVLTMARKIIDASIPNSLCALDCDYDEQFGTKVDDDRVFYTFGYGVENDIVNEISVMGIMRALLPGLEDVDEHGAKVWELIVETVECERFPLLADQIARARGASILNRDRPQSDLVHNNELPVRFRRAAIRAEVQRARQSGAKSAYVFEPVASFHTVPAHHFLELAYHTFTRYVSKFSRTKFSHDNFVAVCIGYIQNLIFHYLPRVLENHYANLGARDVGIYSTR